MVTNEVGQPRATLVRQAPTPSAVEHPSMAIRPTALTIDFIAHQATTFYRTPDPSHQR